MSPQWISATAALAGMIGMILLAVDRWVHRQDYSAVAMAGEVTRLKEELAAIRHMINEANDRASKKHSEWQTKIGHLEMDVVRLRERERMRSNRGSRDAQATRDDIDRTTK